MRVSRGNLNAVLRRAIDATGRPDLSISEWSPGDGWTRYRLQSQGGARDEGPYLPRGQFFEWLLGFARGAEMARMER